MRQFAEALLSVEELGKAAAGVLYAQFAGETGRGQHCYGWNLGNVKWSKGCGWPYHVLQGVWEGVTPERAAQLIATGQWAPDPNPDHARAVGPGKISIIATPENPASWFRSYPDLTTGMSVFVAAKRNPTSRYASAWPFLVAGDCDGYARELGRRGYYTASPDAYSRAMLAHHREWMASTAYDEALEARAASAVAPAKVRAASSAVAPASVTPDTELPAVDMVTGETWVLPFQVVTNLTEAIEADIERRRQEIDWDYWE